VLVRVRPLEQVALMLVEVTVAGKKPVAHRALDSKRAHRDEAPSISDEHRFGVFSAVDQERVDRPGDEANDVAVLADQILQG
jgi:hypothetical protein